MKQEINFENDIIIDEEALDVEWLNQPQLAMKYGTYWAQCSDVLSKAEEQLKITNAMLNKKINKDPEKYLGVDVKSTVNNIDACILTNAEYKEAKELVQQAQFDLNIALVAKMEISNTRKMALENLVKLHGMNYFAGPSVPRDLTYETAKKAIQTRVDTGIASKMKRTKLKNILNNPNVNL